MAQRVFAMVSPYGTWLMWVLPAAPSQSGTLVFTFIKTTDGTLLLDVPQFVLKPNSVLLHSDCLYRHLELLYIAGHWTWELLVHANVCLWMNLERCTRLSMMHNPFLKFFSMHHQVHLSHLCVDFVLNYTIWLNQMLILGSGRPVCFQRLNFLLLYESRIQRAIHEEKSSYPA